MTKTIETEVNPGEKCVYAVSYKDLRDLDIERFARREGVSYGVARGRLLGEWTDEARAEWDAVVHKREIDRARRFAVQAMRTVELMEQGLRESIARQVAINTCMLKNPMRVDELLASGLQWKEAVTKARSEEGWEPASPLCFSHAGWKISNARRSQRETMELDVEALAQEVLRSEANSEESFDEL